MSKEKAADAVRESTVSNVDIVRSMDELGGGVSQVADAITSCSPRRNEDTRGGRQAECLTDAVLRAADGLESIALAISTLAYSGLEVTVTHAPRQPKS